MRTVDVGRYLRASSRIDGWFSKDAARLFSWVDEIQKANDVVGDLFEIGCHHGKSSQLLGLFVRPESETMAVCDLFGMQSDNVSRSGEGDRDIFEDNMQPVRELGVKYKVFQKNSLTLTSADIGENYRFFHVDGGHNPDEALGDLRLAAECLHEKGVIALDDPFRTEWPGVTEGLIRFLDEWSDFEAVIVGCNKILLTRKPASSMYTDEFESQSAQDDFRFGYPWRIKPMPFHNAQLRVLYVPDYRQKKSIGNLARKVFYSTSLSKGARAREYDYVNGQVRDKATIS